MATATDTADLQRATRLESVALALLCLLGVGLRVAWPERMAVEHFDEGVYAANYFCRPPGLPEGTYPRQYLYAPPLLPEICIWTLFAAGGNPHAVLWINVVAGTLMIPLVWWVARGWFGPAAGLTAAALCACSDVHVAISRMVLTDVLLCLFLTAGVGVGVRAIQTGRPGTIALAGVMAGLAWWTKYNGWLTLAITGAGLAGWLVFNRPQGVSPKKLCLRWLATAAIAVLVWSPVWWSLQTVGGYAVVAENHARYFVGFAGWWDSLSAQAALWAEFDRPAVAAWVGMSTALIAAIVCLAAEQSAHVTRWAYWTGAAVLVGLLSIALEGFSVAVLSLGLAGIVQQLLRRDSGRRRATSSQTLAAWTLLAWMSGLCIATPLYTPYPRLTLPWLCSGWFGLASGVAWLGSRELVVKSGTAWFMVTLAALSGWGLVVSTRGPSPASHSLIMQNRGSTAALAEPLVQSAASDFRASPSPGMGTVQGVLYVFAEPALFYHLSAHKQPDDFRYFVQPIGDHALLDAGAPDSALATFLVTGLHAEAVAADRQAFESAAADGRLTLVGEWDYQSSRLVALDHARGAPVTGGSARVRLYRVRNSR